MPQYELRDPFYEKNGVLKDNGDETSSQPIIISIHVVGDTYGFVPFDPLTRMLTVIVPNKLQDIEQVNQMLLDEAIAFREANFSDK